MTDNLKPRRPRLSLLNLLLLVTAAAMALVAFRQSSLVRQCDADIQSMQGELVRLRAETEQLEVPDPNKLCVRAVGEDGWGDRTWRIYVPAGSTYRLFAKLDGLPEEGLPKVPWPKPDANGNVSPWLDHQQGWPDRRGLQLQSGEHVLACDRLSDSGFNYRLNHLAGSRWSLLAKRSGGETGCPSSTGGLIRRGPLEVMIDSAAAAATDAPPGEEVAVSPDENLVLFDTRTPDSPGQGLLIWLEAVP